MTKRYLLTTPLLLLMASCASNGLQTVSDEQAMAFENSRLHGPDIGKPFLGPSKEPQFQPVNKSEPCLTEALPSLMAKGDVKLYWDGACHNGKAFGLGRQIYDGTAVRTDIIQTNDSDGYQDIYQSALLMDVLHKVLVSNVMQKDDDSALLQKISIPDGPGEMSILTGVIAPDRQTADMHVQFPANLKNIFVREMPTKGFRYKIIDAHNDPVTDLNQLVFQYGTEDLKTQIPKGGAFGAVGFGQSFNLMMDGENRERVNLPKTFIQHGLDVYSSIKGNLNAHAATASTLNEDASAYMSKACAAKAAPAGIPKDLYFQACSMDRELKSRLNQAVLAQKADYAIRKPQSDQLRLDVAQRNAAIASQNAMQQQQQQAQMQSISNNLATMNANMNQQTQSILNGAGTYQAPQVTPVTPGSSNGIIKCISTGFYTNCRQ
ncbi:hypothetical protein ACTVH1_17490 [Gluconobacter cerinus]